MACGADWGGYEGGYNDAYYNFDYGQGEWDYGDRAGYQAWTYENEISKDEINGEILTNQGTGMK